PLLVFMRELWSAFHSHGLEVSQSVPIDDAAFDYRGLAKVTDTLVLMAYDEHASETVAGPVASQPWFTASLERRIVHDGLDPSHVIVAIGSYGYDCKNSPHEGQKEAFQRALRNAAEA